MANTDDGGNAMFTEHMPAPPPFWRFFTKENMEQLEKLKENDDSIPSNLNALVPPPIPIDGKYRNFGGTFSVTAHYTCFSFTETNVYSYTNYCRPSKSYNRNNSIRRLLQHRQAMSKVLENQRLALLGH
jgi:hypothetical protein